MNTEHIKKAYVVAVDMGYGHQRAVFPLMDIAVTPKAWEGEPENTKIISANKYVGIPKIDKDKWQSTRTLYEWVSRMRSIPLIGNAIFGVMDYVQRIQPFYPIRDLSAPGIQTKEIYKMIKGGFGKDLITVLNKDAANHQKPLPFLTSFFMTAFLAEEHGYVGDIFCLCTDTDVSRAWAPLHPQKSRIIYLAPSERVQERLKMYGISADKIIFTGFPLPKEESSEQAVAIARRVAVLDPHGIYIEKYQKLLSAYLGRKISAKSIETDSQKPVTVTFAVGGAGAQTDIGVALMHSLKNEIKQNKIRLCLSVGTSEEARVLFEKEIKELGINVFVLYHKNKFEYFKLFDELLLDTDVLWTKPSELSFYVGLGVPIVIAPPLGSQEICNQSWLLEMGAGINQLDPYNAREWLLDAIKSGRLAEAAMNGYIHAPKMGVENIQNIL